MSKSKTYTQFAQEHDGKFFWHCDAGEKLIPVPVRLTPAQREKLQRIGPQRLRDWLDLVKD